MRKASMIYEEYRVHICGEYDNLTDRDVSVHLSRELRQDFWVQIYLFYPIMRRSCMAKGGHARESL